MTPDIGESTKVEYEIHIPKEITKEKFLKNQIVWTDSETRKYTFSVWLYCEICQTVFSIQSNLL